MTNLRARVRRDALFITAGLAALVVAMPAMAQSTQEDEKVDVTSSTTEEETSAKAITVTGSRIRNPNLQGFSPTTSIDREFIDQRNFVNVADALNTLPQIRGSVTPNGGQAAFGQGVNFINNFGLGSNRTLTLINGRRVVTSNPPSLFGPAAAGTQVDVNIIPTALLKSVDIVSTKVRRPMVRTRSRARSTIFSMTSTKACRSTRLRVSMKKAMVTRSALKVFTAPSSAVVVVTCNCRRSTPTPTAFWKVSARTSSMK